MSLNPSQGETAAASVNPPQTEIVAPFDQYGTLMSVEDQERDRLLLVDDMGVEAQAHENETATVARDSATSKELALLNGLPVVPAPQPQSHNRRSSKLAGSGRLTCLGISRSSCLSATLRSTYDETLYVAKCMRMTRLRVLRRLESVAGLAPA
ncbi:unnamed protein product [Arabis nemorensis]|uniref:Uncharacterized protein n=1 Tax=Arabis nemorensis TaxID=586526 RepID=A0A565C4B7_9BRAS|nr:unnamed protein product [Arabis nemorensis]